MDPISVVSMVLGPVLGRILGGTPERLKGTPLPAKPEPFYKPEFAPLPGAELPATLRQFDSGPGMQVTVTPVSLSGAKLAAASMFPEQNKFNVGDVL